MTFSASPPARRVSRWALWFGVLAGPLAWTAHLLLSYPLVYVACGVGWWGMALLNAITLATALLAVAGGVVGWRSWRRAGPGADPPAGSVRFMGRSGVLLSALFLFAILLEGAPNLALSPCS